MRQKATGSGDGRCWLVGAGEQEGRGLAVRGAFQDVVGDSGFEVAEVAISFLFDLARDHRVRGRPGWRCAARYRRRSPADAPSIMSWMGASSCSRPSIIACSELLRAVRHMIR